MSAVLFSTWERKRGREQSLFVRTSYSLSPEQQGYFIYDYTDTSRDPEMLHVNAYNLYNIRLMDEIGPFHHEPKQ